MNIALHNKHSIVRDVDGALRMAQESQASYFKEGYLGIG